MLEFFELEDKNGYVSLYDNHITINKSLMEYIKEAYRVRIAIDKLNNEMYIYPISKDYALSGELKESSLLQISLSKTYARVCSKPLLEYLCKQFNITILKKEYKRYNASYDESKKAIIVNMKGVEE